MIQPSRCSYGRPGRHRRRIRDGILRRARAYRDGEWKLVYAPVTLGGTGDYALYNLRSDPGETTDVAAAHPDITHRLAAEWDRYATENGVVPAPFDAVNAAADRMAAMMYAADWAE